VKGHGANVTSSPTRLAALDELRGLAILAVVASHIGLVFGPDLEVARFLTIPALGVGVDLFFVISGFLVAESVSRARIDCAGAFWRGALAFWAGRLLRIGLPAWATLALIVGLRALGVLPRVWDADLVASAGFYANVHWASCFEGQPGCGDLRAASQFWSLASEMQFYLVAPLLLALRLKVTAAAGLLILIAGSFCDRPWGGFWWTFRADGLAVGVLLSLAGARRWPLPQMGSGLTGFWLLVASILVRTAGVLAPGASVSGVALIFGFVVASSVGRASGSEPPTPMEKLGILSFSVYLTHLPIMTAIHQLFIGRVDPIVLLSSSIVAILLGAIGMDRFVTSPSQILGRRILRRICRGSDVPAPRDATPSEARRQ